MRTQADVGQLTLPGVVIRTGESLQPSKRIKLSCSLKTSAALMSNRVRVAGDCGYRKTEQDKSSARMQHPRELHTV